MGRFDPKTGRFISDFRNPACRVEEEGYKNEEQSLRLVKQVGRGGSIVPTIRDDFRCKAEKDLEENMALNVRLTRIRKGRQFVTRNCLFGGRAPDKGHAELVKEYGRRTSRCNTIIKKQREKLPKAPKKKRKRKKKGKATDNK